MEWHEGHVIRHLRDDVKWTLRTLAKASKVHMHVIHRIEKGLTKDPKTSTLDRIAKAFGAHLSARDIRNQVPPAGPKLILEPVNPKRPRLKVEREQETARKAQRPGKVVSMQKRKDHRRRA